ncbi:MAG TPA: SUMF1/EgtB/PvdO family nonheme iron enzyme [Acidobacteriaceae bacterium]|jgi:formylglycine-generating enzyme required for sulfatase activity|nr:SUMF1/EgtB/PvdO family nonheme iron enzyme [Acidobacteriaceae bacterium]
MAGKIQTTAALGAVLIASGLAISAFAQENVRPQGEQISPPSCLVHGAAWEGRQSGPCTSEDYANWQKAVQHWRFERRIRQGLTPETLPGVPDFYQFPQLQWIHSDFMQPQMMVQDRYFYDPATKQYTVDKYLNDVTQRYGGIDAVLIWATYPNMGIDARNQLQMVESMPGGYAGVRQVVEEFHRHGVRVLFPMMMWDQGTHEPEQPWPDAIAKEMKEIDADGVNGDTQQGVPLAFSLAAVQSGHPLAFEPEGGPADEADRWDVLGWAYYKFDFVPTVDRYRWLEPEHEVNISDRWNRSKTDDLQYALFNGEGWESWENVWGIWNGITPRDGEATRRVASIEREAAPFFESPGWQPFYPMELYGVFASRWPMGDRTLWTIVNRNEYEVSGEEMITPAEDGVRYFDLYHGVELKPERRGNNDVLTFPMEAHGYGAVLALHGVPDARLEAFLSRMKAMTERPLSSYPDTWKVLPQHIEAIAKTAPADTMPAGMVKIPGGDYVFRVEGTEIEGSNDIGTDVQYPWENSPRRYHEHKMHIDTFYMDKYPVTNAEYRKFLDATHYHPADDYDFLKDWKNGTYPDGWGNKPVTWVSREDAEAYAKWAGKRLPNEWEWQYAAQGGDETRLYPWGNTWNPADVPQPEKGRALTGPADVDAQPGGASPFGVLDMVGNVWQWTNVFEDEHTRAAVLRGGSYYQAQGSVWYFPQAYRNDEHSKYLLMAPSYDRSGTLGFRCVRDAAH